MLRARLLTVLVLAPSLFLLITLQAFADVAPGDVELAGGLGLDGVGRDPGGRVVQVLGGPGKREEQHEPDDESGRTNPNLPFEAGFEARVKAA